MDISAFTRHRQHMLSTPPHLRDGGNMDLYATLRAHDPERFGTIAPSVDRKAPHRCHTAEAFLEHMNLDWPKANTLVSHGVRATLSAVCAAYAHTNRTLVLPSDVYPVYQQIAQASGVSTQTYPARLGVGAPSMDQPWALLVCNPLKPWGGTLSDEQWRTLITHAQDHNGVVLVDAAYDLAPPPVVLELMTAGAPVVFLGSLSKGWLLPWHAGITLGPPEHLDPLRAHVRALPVDTDKLRIAFAALTDHGTRPKLVHNEIAHRRQQGLSTLEALSIPVSHADGYFVVTPQSPIELIKQGVLGIPSTVFGAPPGGPSLISVLGLEPT